MTTPFTDPYVPSPVTWSSLELISAPQLRSDVSGAVQLLSTPPFFEGAQTLATATVTSGTATAIVLDTEYADSLNGHEVNNNGDKYYGMFAGWYLCETSVSLNYTGGAGSLRGGVAFTHSGTTATYMGMSIPNTSGFRSQVSGAKLIHFTSVGTFGGASNDYVQLYVFQDSGTSHALFESGEQYPLITLNWVCASTGTHPLPVPANDTWPSPTTTLTSGVSAGGTSLPVAATTGMVYYGGHGGTLGIDIGLSTAETVAITASPSGLNVPVTPLAYAHSSGATVTVPVSAAFMNKNVRDAVAFLAYPPLMECQYLNASGAGQSLASQTNLANPGLSVSLDTKTVDNYGAASTSKSIWTAPVAGIYYCHGQVSITGVATSVSLAAGLTVTSANYNSGTTTTLWGGAITAYTSGPATACTTRRLRLNAGDTLWLAGFQNDSGSNAAGLRGTGDSCCRLITIWQGS